MALIGCLSAHARWACVMARARLECCDVCGSGSSVQVLKSFAGSLKSVSAIYAAIT